MNDLKRLVNLMVPYKIKILLATLCSASNKLCDIVPEILIGISIDVIVNQQHSIVARLGIVDPFKQLYLIGGITALLWILESVFEYLYSILWQDVALAAQQGLRVETYAHLQKLDTAYFEKKTKGGLLAILQDDIAQLEQFFAQAPNAVIQLLVNIVVLGGLFIYLSPTLALLAMLPIPFVIGIAYYFQDRLATVYVAVRERTGLLSGHIAQRLAGISTIKSFSTESYEEQLFAGEGRLLQEAQARAFKLKAAYIPTIRMAIMVGFIAILIIGGYYALRGWLPINWYAALVFLTQRFLWPFTEITTITSLYEQSMASARRVFQILDLSATIKDGSYDLPRIVKGEVHFDKISFAYGAGENVLKDVTCTIPAKKTAAFVGTTGSGKSTLIKLLLRFYDVSQGQVTIDGLPIKSLKLAALRKAIALVSQDIYLIDGTIAENISYGTFDATRQEIMVAAQLAEAHAFIEQMSQGYESPVGEDGKNLSGGQRQRIAIARAVLKKAPILIFDEATSAVDNETEAAIQKSFMQLSHHHTMIIIAHRLSTVRHADIIFVVDKGQIIESGSHNELLQKDGAYAKLWHLQTGEW